MKMFLTWFFSASKEVTTLAKACLAGNEKEWIICGLEEVGSVGSVKSSRIDGNPGVCLSNGSVFWTPGVPVLLVHLLKKRFPVSNLKIDRPSVLHLLLKQSQSL